MNRLMFQNVMCAIYVICHDLTFEVQAKHVRFVGRISPLCRGLGGILVDRAAHLRADWAILG